MQPSAGGTHRVSAPTSGRQEAGPNKRQSKHVYLEGFLQVVKFSFGTLLPMGKVLEVGFGDWTSSSVLETEFSVGQWVEAWKVGCNQDGGWGLD